MISHWDDVPWKRHEYGDRRFERQSLSRARGSAGATLSRYRIAAGDRSMPLHVHIDEEEMFYVLAGRGLVWQGDAVHEVRAGDLIVHLADREPHTLLAPTTPTSRWTCSRTRAARRRNSRCCRARASRGSARAGCRRTRRTRSPPSRRWPPASCRRVAPRPPTIVALDDVEPSLQDRGPVHRTRRDLGRAAGSRLSGLQHVDGRRPAGARPCATATRTSTRSSSCSRAAARCCSATSATRCGAGSIVARPPGTGVAHSFEAGDDGLVMLAYGTRDRADACWYPDSRKISLARARRDLARRAAGLLGRRGMTHRRPDVAAPC